MWHMWQYSIATITNCVLHASFPLSTYICSRLALQDKSIVRIRTIRICNVEVIAATGDINKFKMPASIYFQQHNVLHESESSTRYWILKKKKYGCSKWYQESIYKERILCFFLRKEEEKYFKKNRLWNAFSVSSGL